MNYINLPKDIKNMIGSFLFNTDRHQAERNYVLMQIHSVKNKHYLYRCHTDKSTLRFLRMKTIPLNIALSDELDEMYRMLYLKRYTECHDQLDLKKQGHVKTEGYFYFP
jgi:hypothetical protein